MFSRNVEPDFGNEKIEIDRHSAIGAGASKNRLSSRTSAARVSMFSMHSATSPIDDTTIESFKRPPGQPVRLTVERSHPA